MQRLRLIETTTGLSLFAGLLFAISPWLFQYSDNSGGTVASVIIGVLVIVLAAGQFFDLLKANIYPNIYRILGVINLVLGLVMISAPWTFSYSSVTGAVWSNVIFGAIVALLAAGGDLATTSYKHATQP